ncbi:MULTISPECIES: hypothetical protein [Thermomonas]|uniref:hypothetical protein n=1 Tax=Thermomonas TaxID=141948 RepID=UPI0012EBA88B|nr:MULTISPECIES: hypothetical protein [Thermomonas]
MPARRKPSSRRAPAVFFTPTPRHLWLAALGLLATVRRLLPTTGARRGRPPK